MTVALVVLDFFLALGAALRLTRFVVADDVPGQWWIKNPLDRWVHGEKQMAAYDRLVEHRGALIQDGHDPDTLEEPLPPPVDSRRLKSHRYLQGLGCPFCISVYMAAFTVLTLWLAGGLGDAADWWRYPAGFLTLAWLTGHIASLVGDTED